MIVIVAALLVFIEAIWSTFKSREAIRMQNAKDPTVSLLILTTKLNIKSARIPLRWHIDRQMARIRKMMASL